MILSIVILITQEVLFPETIIIYNSIFIILWTGFYFCLSVLVDRFGMLLATYLGIWIELD